MSDAPLDLGRAFTSETGVAVGDEAPLVGQARSVAVVGLDAVEVAVEAFVGPGLPGFQVIGSSGAAARQASDRVRTALGTLGLSFATRKILVSLAPADVPKAGARYDLAMAAAVLAQLGVVPHTAVANAAMLGELALDGGVRPVPGVLPSAARLLRAGVRQLFVADANAAEAVLVGDLDVIPVADLAEAVELLRGERAPRPVPPAGEAASAPGPDLMDVRGQPEARRALEIAAAGGHHVLLLGPPGCGKSMLASRLPGILPTLTTEQALELTAVRSVAGLLTDGGDRPLLDRTPPFRAPHHTTSPPALLGGGTGVARPGELSLAHRGVLFLDELFEWSRRLLESLREPLEEGVVRVARSRAVVAYPARFQLVCAANPCPCGGGDACDCTDRVIWAYRSRLSGPLADRIDLAPAVTRLRAHELLGGQEHAESSAVVAARVHAARAMATERWGAAAATNAEAPASALRRSVDGPALRTLAAAVDDGVLTGRGYDRTLRVARTCADLEGRDRVSREHVLEALGHRFALRSVRLAGPGGSSVTSSRVPDDVTIHASRRSRVGAAPGR